MNTDNRTLIFVVTKYKSTVLIAEQFGNTLTLLLLILNIFQINHDFFIFINITKLDKW